MYNQYVVKYKGSVGSDLRQPDLFDLFTKSIRGFKNPPKIKRIISKTGNTEGKK